MESRSAFIRHLESPVHQNQSLQCHGCLRYFFTATALTQHSEAQGDRCKVRLTDGFDAEVDRITAGTIATAGRLSDNSIRYVAKVGQAPVGLAEAHRAAGVAREEKRKNYWTKNTPNW